MKRRDPRMIRQYVHQEWSEWMHETRTGGRCYMHPADAACALTRWQHFSAWNDVVVAILKVQRHIGNPTQSIEEQFPKRQPNRPTWSDIFQVKLFCIIGTHLEQHKRQEIHECKP